MILDLGAGFGSPVKQDLPPVSPGALFWPIAWSPDGALVAGTAVTAGQVGDIHVWSVAERAYRRMPWNRGEQVDYSLVFIDRDTIVYGSSGELWLGNIRAANRSGSTAVRPDTTSAISPARAMAACSPGSTTPTSRTSG